MKPSVTIITVVCNGSLTIADCLISLASQKSPCEHIIIDGGSTDGTQKIIGKFPHVSRIISEQDNGIYDAMNKGISLAQEDIVGILNADDFYVSDSVIENIMNVFEDGTVDACYGDLTYGRMKEDEKGRGLNSILSKTATPAFDIVRYWKSGSFNPNKFYWGWMPPHPTFFVRRSVYEKYGLFNLDMGTAADYELMLRFLLKHKINCKYIPEILVCMRTGGMSNASVGNRLRANRNDRKAWDVNCLKPYPWTIPLKPLRKIPQWFRNAQS